MIENFSALKSMESSLSGRIGDIGPRLFLGGAARINFKKNEEKEFRET